VSIATFHCAKDEDVQFFVQKRAVLYERKHKARTYFIVDHKALEAGTLEILAYFSVALKVVQIAADVTIQYYTPCLYDESHFRTH
jgi:hypothetical protein